MTQRPSFPNTPQYHSGVVLNEHPYYAPLTPRTVYESLVNFRVMPNPHNGPNWLRLWGGRKARYYGGSGAWQRFHEYTDPVYGGWNNHIAQHNLAGVVKWKWISLNNFLITDILTISQAYDLNWTQNNPAAVCNMRDRIIIYNGLGVRDGTGSRPPFSSYFPSINQLMYLGLDAYVPGGTPPSVAIGGAGTITTTDTVKLYVGIYNSYTGHFSNAVLMGSLAAMSDKQINVTNLNLLPVLSHDVIEQGYQRYVFYATIPGLEVPYLLMDSDLITPLTQFVTSTTFTITALNLDPTKEASVTGVSGHMKFPPRPMRWVALMGGRLYGALMQGGAGTGATPDFHYQSGGSYFSGIVYSYALSDAKDTEFLGAPEEAWPLNYFSPTPNGEIPIHGAQSPDGYLLHILTPTGGFLVEQAADGVHEWTRLAGNYGTRYPLTYARTNYGSVWVSQDRDIILLPPGSRQPIVLSSDYRGLIAGKTPSFGTYTYDPANYIDRYEVYFTDGTGVVHDFAIGGGYAISPGLLYTAGASLTRQDDKRFHLVADSNLYTQAGQPEDGLEKCRNERYTAPAATALDSIAGSAITHWSCYGDPESTKTMPELRVLGDGASLVVSWRRDMSLQWFDAIRQLHADNPMLYRFMLGASRALWYKFKFALSGPVNDDTYPAVGGYGDSLTPAIGAIFDVRHTGGGDPMNK